MARKVFENDIEVKNVVAMGEVSSEPGTEGDLGQLFVDQNDKKPYFKASDGTVYPLVPEGSAVNGGVFITNVEPQNPLDNVSIDTTSSGGLVVESIITNTTEVRIHVLAITGNTNYKPEITVNGNSVTNMTITSDETNWSGYIDLDLAAGSPSSPLIIEAEHEDGATHSATVSIETGPEVLSVAFTGGYPGSQTELKAGDTFDLQVTTDKPMNQIYVYDDGACTFQTFTVSPAATSETVTVTIADRGTSTQALAAKIKCRGVNGSYGNDANTDDSGSADGVNTVNLNNTYPGVTIGAISYPPSQEAIKDSESATVANTLTNYDSVTYDSPTSELSVTNPTSPGTPKTVTRISGGYNITTNNFRITANRAANDATTISQAIVKIAHDDQVITVSTPSRLRSGGNNGTSAQSHTVQITSTQELMSAPTLALPGSGSPGTWLGAGFTGSGTSWSRQLQVHDDDDKGVKSWGALWTQNLAGKIVTLITAGTSYELGGFVLRTLTIGAWPNRIADIGTEVSDTAKLQCTNFSKGSDSGDFDCLYQSDKTENEFRFTITDASEVLDPNGSYWYNVDTPNAVSNTGGTAQIEIEETI